MSELLLREDRGPVRILTLNRLSKRNAFDSELAAAFRAALEEDAPEIRAIVVTAAGDFFTAGADLNLFVEAAKGNRDSVRPVGTLYEPLRSSTKPVIAAVQGHAIGMGVTILPHFDLVYAAEEATFVAPFTRLGIVVEFGGSYTLSRLIGHQRAREMLLRGKPIDAKTAEKWGLVTRVFPRAQLLDAAILAGMDIAESAEIAIEQCRDLLDYGVDASFEQAIAREDEILGTRYGSPENVAAIDAFLARKRA